METTPINLTNEFKALRNAFNDPAKYVSIPAARRTGKTHEAFDWIHHELLMTDAPNAMWVDTVQVNISKYVDRYCRTRLAPMWHLMKWDQQKNILTYPNGKTLDFGSAQKPENLEGFEYARVVINEAGIVLRKSSLWDNSIQPMTKGKHNKTRILGTPKGRNRFHELDVLGRSGDPDYASFHFSAYDSPYWEDEELDKIRGNVPAEVWRQEYMAEFLEGSGTVFRSIEECVNDVQLMRAEPDRRYIMGVDLAKHQDFTVIFIADIESKQVVFMDRFNQIDWPFQKTRIAGAWKAFNEPQVIIDSTGVGDAVYDDLRSAGMNVTGFKFTNSSKMELVQNLSVAIDNVAITFPPYEELISELEVFGYDVSPSGNLRYNAPEGLHDDCVMALGLLNHGLKSNKSFSFIANY